ncbi:hypothetical protein [Streptomyces purpureus]|uniref:Lipoprotein n=1 Tax=Streptomyces purpureus TaxID=1951 RepID=A0A918GXB0_9ACTN|nr:hypothetical protein [Streptomyces purpureus]GGT14327.1 hypothetical protein GCM10014713_03730 [Streptomyces purpureus]
MTRRRPLFLPLTVLLLAAAAFGCTAVPGSSPVGPSPIAGPSLVPAGPPLAAPEHFTPPPPPPPPSLPVQPLPHEELASTDPDIPRAPLPTRGDTPPAPPRPKAEEPEQRRRAPDVLRTPPRRQSHHKPHPHRKAHPHHRPAAPKTKKPRPAHSSPKTPPRRSFHMRDLCAASDGVTDPAIVRLCRETYGR